MSLTRFQKPTIVAEETESVRTVAQKMREKRVGCAVITRGRRPVGILTDRDIALRIVAEGRDARTTVAEVATYDPIVATVDEEIASAAAKMRKHGIRRLPLVTSEGELAGIVTADDLVVFFSRELADLGEGFSDSADADDSR